MSHFSQNLSYLLSDIRYSFRGFRRNPGFTFLILLILALSIGATSSVISISNAVLLRPFPYDQPQDLVSLWSARPAQGIEKAELSWSDVGFFRSNINALSSVAAYDEAALDLQSGDLPQRVMAGKITTNLFQLLGLRPLIGRDFVEADQSAAVLLLSEGLWKRQFDADVAILGQGLVLSGRSYTVVGVLPSTADLPMGAELWLPFTDQEQQDLINEKLSVLARLAPGSSLDQVRAQTQALSRLLAEEIPAYRDRELLVMSLRDQRVGKLRTILLLLVLVTVCVLLIASANIASMLLARDQKRRRDVAVRAALGATPGRVAAQLLTESGLIAVAGGFLGLALGWWSVKRLLTLVPVEIPSWIHFGLDYRVLLLTFLASLISVLVFGLIPARQAARFDVMDALRGSLASGAVSPRGKRLQQVLLIGEIAVSMMLLVGALLFVRSFLAVSQVDPGFAAERRISFSIDVLKENDSSATARDARLTEVIQKLAALPEVAAVAAVSDLPLAPSGTTVDITAVGQTEEEFRRNPLVLYKSISTNFFETLDIAIRQGEGFNGRDQGERVAVVDEELAQLFWPGQNPIGKFLNLGGPTTSFGDWLEVRGVVANVKHFGLDQKVFPTLYVPYDIAPKKTMNLVVETRTAAGNALPAIRRAVGEVEKGKAIYEVRKLDELLDRSLWQPRLFTALFWALALIALLLTASGLYGTISYSVAQRTREFGLRMALGADRSRLIRSVLGQGLYLVLIGILCGLPLAVGLALAMKRVLFGISSLDPLTFIAVPLLLLLTALGAAYAPARRATKVDPMSALRTE